MRLKQINGTNSNTRDRVGIWVLMHEGHRVEIKTSGIRTDLVCKEPECRGPSSISVESPGGSLEITITGRIK